MGGTKRSVKKNVTHSDARHETHSDTQPDTHSDAHSDTHLDTHVDTLPKAYYELEQRVAEGFWVPLVSLI